MLLEKLRVPGLLTLPWLVGNSAPLKLDLRGLNFMKERQMNYIMFMESFLRTKILGRPFMERFGVKWFLNRVKTEKWKRLMSKNWIVLSVCFIFCGCSSRSAMMTQDSFSSVQVGTSIQTIVQERGEPYSIRDKNGMEEYTYIERVTNGNQLIYENHFILFVKDGLVVGKTTTQEKRPAFELIYQDDPNHSKYP